MKPFHPNLKAVLQFQDEKPLCLFCQNSPMEFQDVPQGRLSNFFYCCRLHSIRTTKIAAPIGYFSLSHASNNNNSVNLMEFYFKTNPENLWAYAIRLFFDNNQMSVDKEYESPEGENIGYTPNILICPIPKFNIFNLPLLANKIKLYQTLS